ncbi:MAG TPA: (5-formylfuran-3-yl)methyl phosphate synthase [Gemmatimonadales bacterium]|jgi:uncharacterized protein (UPF0264 family)|nr:(5-formylfuran-3-yl)methyl phosphate synthase [Gemmatimonadales bacterium]
MQLLVSVADGREARAALQGGADVIDAKDPRRGALGPVGPAALAAIRDAVPRPHPLSVALGDASEERAIAHAARRAARHGVAFLKVGFAGLAGAARARRLATAARWGAGERAELVLVAYADWRRAASLAPERVLAVAATVGAHGVLLDTAFKNAPVFALVSPDAVGAWVTAAHAAGLFAALAGSLGGADFATARALGADLVGVRGAACVGGRTGRVSPSRVAALRALAGAIPPARAAALG